MSGTGNDLEQRIADLVAANREWFEANRDQWLEAYNKKRRELEGWEAERNEAFARIARDESLRGPSPPEPEGWERDSGRHDGRLVTGWIPEHLHEHYRPELPRIELGDDATEIDLTEMEAGVVLWALHGPSGEPYRQSLDSGNIAHATEHLPMIDLRSRVKRYRSTALNAVRHWVSHFEGKFATDGHTAATIGFLGGKALADALGVHPSRRDAFLKKLGRSRRSLDDDNWKEDSNPTPNSPRFLYLPDAPAIQDLAAPYKTPKSA